ncbi:MAG: prepilin-type N-terminal cleavage/methylation domain-containing protein [Fimbriimonadaceae bacterium]|nr:prepilin-type N-terminal cleavage/methylation domain-containing protein [Fimbriimonadaceae bacterium]QYK55750.1 MAG: prepilin-type N-terminal cleavage/methylation domain-containing protein [Fimbriimonadaceae bacterium]
MRRKGFTLIELLVVIAIIAILAAILFPVFAQAKSAAKKSLWLQHFKQANIAVVQYMADNQDGLPPCNMDARSRTGSGACWGCGYPNYPNDQIWVQLVMPYTKSWEIWRVPVDPYSKEDKLAVDPYTNAPYPKGHPNYYYAMASRSHVGMNYSFLSPWLYDPVNRLAGSKPVNSSQIESQADTLFGVESIWDRNSASGVPEGGGNWVVEAPCVRDSAGNWLVPIDVNQWYSYGGWVVNQTGRAPYSWREFGGAWPWFTRQFMATFVDSHAKPVSLGRLVDGCDVRSNYGGRAYDGDKYLYDLR